MPKRRIETKEMDAVVGAVAAYPQGASADDVASRLLVPLHKRTLQRRLERLEKSGKIRRTGKGAKTRYWPSLPVSPVEAEGRPASQTDGTVAGPTLTLNLDVSSDGTKIFQAVSKPRRERRPGRSQPRNCAEPTRHSLRQFNG
jgi:hypothetical protein